jgi:hypothetical protein
MEPSLRILQLEDKYKRGGTHPQDTLGRGLLLEAVWVAGREELVGAIQRPADISNLNAGKVFQCTGAVADAFGPHSHSIQQRHVQVRYRRLFLKCDMCSRVQASAGPPGKQDRQVIMAMFVAVAEPGTVNRH